MKTVHFTELREAINTLRSRRTPALPAFTWTEAARAVGGPVRASPLANLHTALSGIAPQSYGEAVIAGTSAIKASHLAELRNALRGLE